MIPTPEVMGVLNITPDSFYQASRTTSITAAIDLVENYYQAGANWVDIGAESTRPGATAIPAEVELKRIKPVLTAIKSAAIPIKISVDTRNPLVMEYAAELGVAMINDINALQHPQALNTLTKYPTKIVLMHMQNQPDNMQQDPQYNNIIIEIKSFLANRIQACIAAGIDPNRIIIDPGFGFGKTVAHNWQLLQQLEQLRELKMPILIGISRKSFIGKTVNISDPESRGVSSAIVTSFAILKGANIIRTHDVNWTIEAIKLAQAFKEPL